MVRPVDGSSQPPVSNTETTPVTSSNADSAKAESATPSSPTSETQSTKVSDPGKQVAEHSIGGQARAAQLQSQLPVTEPKGHAADGATATATPQPTQTKSMQRVMKDSGMANVSDPPTETELKTYYSQKAPAHEKIAAGKYADAATEYRKLAAASNDDAEKARLNQTAKQLETTATMSTSGVKNLSFPPTEGNVDAYFASKKGKPIGEIKSAFEDYSNSFYVHSETKGVDKGDIKYDPETHQIGNTTYKTNTVEDWADINNSREMHTDGRRIVDCEGYAYLGQKAFKAAGFTQGTYAGALRKDDPNTPADESLQQHMMYAARRTVTDENGKQRTEVIAVSNSKTYTADTDAHKNGEEAEAAALTRGYRDAYRSGNVSPGGAIVRESEPWKVMWELDKQVDQLKSKK